jgi:hypothetical protein
MATMAWRKRSRRRSSMRVWELSKWLLVKRERVPLKVRLDDLVSDDPRFRPAHAVSISFKKLPPDFLVAVCWKHLINPYADHINFCLSRVFRLIPGRVPSATILPLSINCGRQWDISPALAFHLPFLRNEGRHSILDLCIQIQNSNTGHDRKQKWFVEMLPDCNPHDSRHVSSD